MLFETSRLICRRWLPRDLDALYTVYSDSETVRWCGDGSPLTMRECQEWFVVTERNYAKYGYGMFAFEDKNRQVAGFGGLVHPGGQVDAEVKYAFDRSRWGFGLASEIVPALLDYGASEHGLDRIIATVAAENKASQRVLIKSGMELEASCQDDDGSVTHTFAWQVFDERKKR